MNEHDPVAAAQALDNCWLTRRFHTLSDYFAPDAIVVAPGGRVVAGIEAIIENYRDIMASTEVRNYAASGYFVAIRGDTAFVEHDWAMDWATDDQPHSGAGRETLAMFRREDAWRVFWRTQNFSPTPRSH